MNRNLLFVLKNKPFLFLWLAEIFSQIASNMTNFILLLVVFSLTHSSTAVSGIMLAFLVPAILLGILAGVYVDRRDKKHVLTITNVTRCIILVLLSFFNTNLALVYLLTFAVSAATQFFIPAETPMIPLLVEKKDLFAANALFSVAFYGSLLIAYALSGPFLIFFGQHNAFLLLAIFFLIASLFSSLIRRSVVIKQKSRQGRNLTISGEIKTALSLIFTIKNIYHSFLMVAISQILILVIAVIGPGFATNILGIPVNTFPLLFVTPAAIGMGVGALLLIHYFHNASKHTLTIVGLFATSLILFAMPFGSQIVSTPTIMQLNAFLPVVLKLNVVHFMSILAFFSGLANALIFVPANTLIQEETSDEIRGKIYGSLNALVALFSLVPIIVVGSLADIFGVSVVLVVIAISIACIGVVRLFL